MLDLNPSTRRSDLLVPILERTCDPRCVEVANGISYSTHARVRAEMQVAVGFREADWVDQDLVALDMERDEDQPVVPTPSAKKLVLDSALEYFELISRDYRS